MIGVICCIKKGHLIFECFRFYFWKEQKRILTNVPCSPLCSEAFDNF